MASLIRRTYLALDEATGRSVRRTMKPWYGKYQDANGVWRRVKLCTDKAAAQAMLNDIVRKVQRGEAEILDRFADHRKRPLAEHVEAFRNWLESRGGCPKHVKQTASRLSTMFAGCGFKRLPDLNTEAVGSWLHDRRQVGAVARKTCNYHIQAARQFGAWLVRSKRWLENPFATLAPIGGAAENHRERRSLAAEEFARLVDAAAASATTLRKLSGLDRAMLYQVAVGSGLRARELGSLTPGNLDLAADPPTITVEAAYSKRRRRDVQEIRPDLAAALHCWLSDARLGISREERLWPGSWANVAASLLRADLEAARAAWLNESRTQGERGARERSDFLAYVDEAGRVFDFHALRHQYITSLAEAGVHPKIAQQLARHSTITLTMDRYTHLSVVDASAALSRLPAVHGPDRQPELQAARANGTDGRRPDSLAHPLAQTPGGKGVKLAVPGVDAVSPLQDTSSTCVEGDSCNSLTECELQPSEEISPAAEGKRRRWESNPRWRICNLPPTQKTAGKTAKPSRTGPPTGPSGQESATDPALARLVEAWPTLPPAIRRAMLALVEA